MTNPPKSLFKNACETCSRSKIRCSGGNPCRNCVKKGADCTYAFKKKRGPKTEVFTNPPLGTSNSTSMSSYERRVWSIFFTIFKTQRKSYTENPVSLGWFVQQLCRLEAYITQSPTAKADKIRDLLQTFYKSINFSKEELAENQIASGSMCPIPPHICGVCTSTVLEHFGVKHIPEPNIYKAGYQNNLPVKHPIDSTHSAPDSPGACGPGALPQAVQDKCMFQKLELWRTTCFDNKFNNDSQPCLVYEASKSAFGIFGNAKFHKLFGYDDMQLANLLGWSGGGFLPWGADVLAALMVNEQDVLLFLKIMTVKYQAHGLPTMESFLQELQQKSEATRHNPDKHVLDEEEEWCIPSLNAFECWVNVGSKEDPVLEPMLVNFSAVVRLKNLKEGMFFRFELTVVSDLDSLKSKKTAKQVTPMVSRIPSSALQQEKPKRKADFLKVEPKSKMMYPERVTNEAPFVKLQPQDIADCHGVRVADRQSVWPAKKDGLRYKGNLEIDTSIIDHPFPDMHFAPPVADIFQNFKQSFNGSVQEAAAYQTETDFNLATSATKAIPYSSFNVIHDDNSLDSIEAKSGVRAEATAFGEETDDEWLHGLLEWSDEF